MLSVVYTFLGGIEGVIWSDVVQGIILLVGAAVILVFGVMAIDGGLVTVAADASAEPPPGAARHDAGNGAPLRREISGRAARSRRTSDLYSSTV